MPSSPTKKLPGAHHNPVRRRRRSSCPDLLQHLYGFRALFSAFEFGGSERFIGYFNNRVLDPPATWIRLGEAGGRFSAQQAAAPSRGPLGYFVKSGLPTSSQRKTAKAHWRHSVSSGVGGGGLATSLRDAAAHICTARPSISDCTSLRLFRPTRIFKSMTQRDLGPLMRSHQRMDRSGAASP